VTALVRPRSNSTVNYRPVLSSERVPHIKKPAIVRQKTKIWSWAPDESPTPRQTGRLTVGRKLTSTSNVELHILKLMSPAINDLYCLIYSPFSELTADIHFLCCRSQLSNGSLYISTLFPEQQGLRGDYQCVATLDTVGSIVSRTARLTVASKWTVCGS
jgi:hypothetical protein